MAGMKNYSYIPGTEYECRECGYIGPLAIEKDVEVGAHGGSEASSSS